MKVHVIGAGLAGSEATWQLVRRGIPVVLHEMRPGKSDPAHHTAYYSELVCSNSLRANSIENAVGLLKEEMRRLDSLIMAEADSHQVPAGGALAVDRVGFAQAITRSIKEHPLVTVVEEEITDLDFPEEDYVVVATGPLTSEALSASIQKLVQKDYFHFFDAAAPIVTLESVNLDVVYKASRYGKGEAAYYNCPFTKEQYLTFWEELCHAEVADVKDFEHGMVFEGCMPIEEMARRGEDTMRFGPLKPVGLPDPRTGEDPYAVV
jgi:methylenetetrahydrofolate--tRNA-(uracil-5-)-methyltransferase